jgi:hypothetical protein
MQIVVKKITHSINIILLVKNIKRTITIDQVMQLDY